MLGKCYIGETVHGESVQGETVHGDNDLGELIGSSDRIRFFFKNGFTCSGPGRAVCPGDERLELGLIAGQAVGRAAAGVPARTKILGSLAVLGRKDPL